MSVSLSSHGAPLLVRPRSAEQAVDNPRRVPLVRDEGHICGDSDSRGQLLHARTVAQAGGAASGASALSSHSQYLLLSSGRPPSAVGNLRGTACPSGSGSSDQNDRFGVAKLQKTCCTTIRGDQGHLMTRERTVPQSEVIWAIFLEYSPCTEPPAIDVRLVHEYS